MVSLFLSYHSLRKSSFFFSPSYIFTFIFPFPLSFLLLTQKLIVVFSHFYIRAFTFIFPFPLSIRFFYSFQSPTAVHRGSYCLTFLYYLYLHIQLPLSFHLCFTHQSDGNSLPLPPPFLLSSARPQASLPLPPPFPYRPSSSLLSSPQLPAHLTSLAMT